MKRTEKLFGVAAVFSTPDEIINAAKAVSDAGYTKYDVHTPYPVHGMDRAMKLKPSNLGMVTLGFGLSGTALALLLMYFTMAFDYPMVIGGKPFFALPAFIPVTFEVTVLLATLATVIGMLAVFFKFPDNSHPLHDTAYMKVVSNDKFGVCIESADPLFDGAKVKELFAALHGTAIEEVYFPERTGNPVFEPKFLGVLALVVVLTSGGTYFILNKVVQDMVPFTWMMKQHRVNAQSPSGFFADGRGMRTPVEGTVARGFVPYEYADAAQPAVPAVNPFKPSPEVIALGKKKYLIFCSPCHGNFAEGDSRLRGQFPAPPSLHSQKVRDWADGNIYHVIVKGQNTMPSYSSQLTPDERWAVVTYVRVLQRAKNASDADIQAARKEGTANVSK